MEPTVLALTVLGGLLVLVVAFVTGRTVQVGRAERALEARTSEADALARNLEQRTEWFEREHVQKAQADLARRQRRLQERQAEHKARVQKAKGKLEARRDKLERRAALLKDREGLLEDAADLLEALQAETEKRRDEADALRTSIQAQAKSVGRRQQDLAAREREIESLESELEAQKRRLDALTETTRLRLEAASGLSRQEAVRQLTEEMRREAKLEAAASIKNIEDEAKQTATRQARQVVLGAVQRLAAQQTVENTVSVVSLQSDDMKGRIIGREGRNIRAFEAATGIEVVVDDTPEAVILSGFDPVRREVARLSMNKLVADGRIHPARIEEVVEKTRGELEEEIVETGERVIVDLSLHGLAPELVRLVGRMRYRSSYGQNLLAHSVEVAKLSSLMAAEVGLDARKARRAGLLHDIGKVIEGDLERPHALAGMEIAHQCKEHPEICNAIGAHHDEIEMTCLIAPIVQAADAASGARPGARREALENYVQRLKTLEALAESFDGVHQAYAIQAGRELRVIVNHERVSDAVAASLARDIVKRIEREMQYPGQIKVTVIREVRNVAFAK